MIFWLTYDYMKSHHINDQTRLNLLPHNTLPNTIDAVQFTYALSFGAMAGLVSLCIYRFYILCFQNLMCVCV
ncbi:unnamed protein product [Trichobilharzia regenti]|nr:unnamed protein product [Trichobilharzia regenti]